MNLTADDDPRDAQSVHQDPPRPARTPWPPVLAILFGLLLPPIAVGVEVATHFCADNLFNPLPTPWHVALYLLIPLATGVILWAGRADGQRWRTAAAVLNGLALAIAAIYTIVFLPILPISVVMIMFMGLGLCGLSPVLALIAMLNSRAYLSRMQAPRRALWIGMAIGLVLMTAVELPGDLTVWGMGLAASPRATTSLHGIHLLRAVGNRRVMLECCYRDPRTTGALLASLLNNTPPSPTVARTIYYRVTGTPFNTEPTPRMKTARGAFTRDTETDWDVGGSTVGGQAVGVSLSSSRLDGSLDAAAALGYLEWTMVFKNTSSLPQEARVQIALPPGAVVSRATLWVDGQEREAAFAARGRARQAYQQVAVVQSRDPLLVTTCGPDRILVQCFPVPADNGAMKIRLGITLPLPTTGSAGAVCLLPRIMERNFIGDSAFKHHVWLESRGRLRTDGAGITTGVTPGGAYMLTGAVSEMTLTTPIYVDHPVLVSESWTPDPLHPKQVIIQRLVATRPKPPTRLVVVLDGSRGMREAGDLLSALSRLHGIPCTLIYAGDTVQTVLSSTALSDTFPGQLRQALRTIQFTGGIDNTAALQDAWDLAATHPGGAILWLHGPQPLDGDIEPLLQRWQRRPDGPHLFALQVIPGSCTVLEGLDTIRAVEAVPAYGSPREALDHLLARWDPMASQAYIVQRYAAPRENARGVQTSQHLARLWARDQAMEFYARQKAPDTEEAIALASAYHLVTPVTGAVVLQTARDYTDNGLEPVKPGSVPTVPEPAEWLLLLAGALALIIGAWWKWREAVHA